MIINIQLFYEMETNRNFVQLINRKAVTRTMLTRTKHLKINTFFFTFVENVCKLNT